MIVFKPRLALFYVVLFATISLLSNKFTVSTQTAHADLKTTTMVDDKQ